jgi:DNA-directed RNA polymerase alpha subunit
VKFIVGLNAHSRATAHPLSQVASITVEEAQGRASLSFHNIIRPPQTCDRWVICDESELDSELRRMSREARGPMPSNAATPVGGCGFSVRASRALKALNIETLEQLQFVTVGQVLRLRAIGECTLSEIREKLAARGLSLRYDSDAAGRLGKAMRRAREHAENGASE